MAKSKKKECPETCNVFFETVGGVVSILGGIALTLFLLISCVQVWTLKSEADEGRKARADIFKDYDLQIIKLSDRIFGLEHNK